MKSKTAAQVKEEDSSFIMHEAVRGMLPTNKMSRHLILKMKAYQGGTHDQQAQKPQPYMLNT